MANLEKHIAKVSRLTSSPVLKPKAQPQIIELTEAKTPVLLVPVDKSHSDFLTHVAKNLRSGLIVALVNLPLSIALSVAGKSTPQSGVITAVISGIISGLLGGSDFNVIGPTGALSGFLAHAVILYKNEGLGDILPLFAIFTGILTFLVLILKLQKYIELFPSGVTAGFTLGVAVIIFLAQLDNAVGLDQLSKHDYLMMDLYETFLNVEHFNELALFICLLFITIYFVGVNIAPKIPWQAILSASGIILGAMVSSFDGYKLITLRDRYGEFQFSGHFFMKSIRIDAIEEPEFYVRLIPIAFVAIVETLISAKIADKMTNTKFDNQGELLSVGLSNIFSGLFGGIPTTAAITRTALNIKSGATHKISSLINSFFMIIISILFFSYFKYLPLPVVAAQIMIVAITMIDYNMIEFYWKLDREQFWIMMTVASLSVLLDTTYGLIIGVFVYLFQFAEKMMESFSEICVATADSSVVNFLYPENLERKKKMLDRGIYKWNSPDKVMLESARTYITDLPVELLGKTKFILYRFIGVINFMNIAHHEGKLDLLPEIGTVFLSLRFVHMLDLEALDSLKIIIEKLQNQQKKVYLCGFNEEKLLEFGKYDKKWLEALVDDGKIWEMRQFAEGKLLTEDNKNYTVLAAPYI